MLDDADLSAVYTLLLNELELNEKHADGLAERGLTRTEMRDIGYKSWPRSRIALAKKIAKEINPTGVPGFFREEGGDWQLAGSAGLAIPIRNNLGQIVGIKLRSDSRRATTDNKYYLLSSNPAGSNRTGTSKYPNGTKASARTHFPLTRPSSVSTVRITEGEIKAEIANASTGVYTLSVPGIPFWKVILDAVREITPQEVLLAFDSDKENPSAHYDASLSDSGKAEPYQIGKAVSSLYRALKHEGFNPKIEDWPAECGKGIDDVIMAGESDQIRVLTEGEASAFVEEYIEGDPGVDWVYILETKVFHNLRTGQQLDKEAFHDKHAPEAGRTNYASAALRDPAFPRVDRPIYLPGKKPIMERDDLTYVNLWRDLGARPAPGDATPFEEHTKLIFPDPMERRIAMDWLAWQVQFPGKKIMWALVVQGSTGTGKSYFGEMFKWLLGDYNVSMPSNDALHEPYTAWQKNCSIVIIEELMARGRLELVNKMKPIITQRVASIREMRKDPYDQPNTFNLLAFTNHKDSLLLDKDDRRWCIIHSSAVAQDEKYFSELFDWSEANAGVILQHLLNRDLSGFNPFSRAPETQGKVELINNSRGPLEEWVATCLEENTYPFNRDLVTTGHLLEVIPPRLRASKPSHKLMSMILEGIGGVNLGQVSLANGSRPRVWAIRRQEMWEGQIRDGHHKIVKDHYEESDQPGDADNFNPIKDSAAM